MTVVRALLFLALGVFVGAVIAQIVTRSAWYAIAWGSAALLAVVLVIVQVSVSLAGGSDRATPPRMPWWAATGAALLGLLAVLLPSAPALIAGPPPAAAPVSSDLRVGNGPQSVVTAVLTASGQSKISELDLRSDYAVVMAPSKSSTTELGLWDYRNGHLLSFELDSGSPEQADALFDARALDFGQVGLAVRKATALSGLRLNSESYVIVQRNPSGGDGPGGLGSPTIEVFIDDGTRDAHVTYNFDLSMVDKGGSVFDG